MTACEGQRKLSLSSGKERESKYSH